jgi:hypothetical protein
MEKKRKTGRTTEGICPEKRRFCSKTMLTGEIPVSHN